MSENSQKGIVIKTLATGIMSASLYALLFMNAEMIMDWFTKGGIYAALPILTAFLFSLVHGAFAGNLWTLFGIEAKSNKVNMITCKEAPKEYQHINPFHNMKITATG